MHPEEQYLELLSETLWSGVPREGRNGGTQGVFGRQIRFDLSKDFPLLTTKRVFFKAIVVELLWFLRGDTNVRYLHDHGVTIWDEWADENGELGPVYGKQWRSWPTGFACVDCNGAGVITGGKFDHNTYNCGACRGRGEVVIDQIKNVINSLRYDPFGRRHIVTAWNPAEIDSMALPPCHCLFQFFVANGKLSCQLYQRSADIFLGVPFNIASYALLTHLIAREIGLEVGEFVHTFGDLHLYANHIPQAHQQLQREPVAFPWLKISDDAPGLFELEPDHIGLVSYHPHPPILAEVSK